MGVPLTRKKRPVINQCISLSRHYAVFGERERETERERQRERDGISIVKWSRDHPRVIMQSLHPESANDHLSKAPIPSSFALYYRTSFYWFFCTQSVRWKQKDRPLCELEDTKNRKIQFCCKSLHASSHFPSCFDQGPYVCAGSKG